MMTSIGTAAAANLVLALTVTPAPTVSHIVEQAGPVQRLTSRFPSVHGAPVHLGLPQSIGIADINKPDYGDAVRIHDDEIPVFWACGVTPQAVIAAARVPFAMTHAPGVMLVTDLKNKHLAVL